MKNCLLLLIGSFLWMSTNGGPIEEGIDIMMDKLVTWDESEITGYHFHTYYFQDNSDSKQQALQFRRQIHAEIEKGVLKGCRLNHFNVRPIGPHPIGSWETCCNSTALSRGMSWFMQNRANHTILLHPLTRYEMLDHTSRAMFLGPSLFLDLHVLSDDLGEPDKCLPIPYEDGGK